MELFNKTIFIKAAPAVVFGYVSNIRGYDAWFKALGCRGRVTGKDGGQKCAVHLRPPHPKTLTLHVTACEENTLFRLEALTACRYLPCYTFLLQPEEGGTSLQLIWEEKGLDPVVKFLLFDKQNTGTTYAAYLVALRRLIQEQPVPETVNMMALPKAIAPAPPLKREPARKRNRKQSSAIATCLYSPAPIIPPLITDVIDKWANPIAENKKLYERLLATEREKIALLEKLLAEKGEGCY